MIEPIPLRVRVLTVSLLMCALLGAIAGSGVEIGAAERRPNVLLIYTDDQGSVDVNCYGAKDLITPNMDALAADGVKFTQFYSAAPVCSPSRAALMTGRYPQRAGLARNASSARGGTGGAAGDGADGVGCNASSARGGTGMPTEQVTLAEMLKAAGYATAHVGKWHLGYTDDQMPNAQGFDYSFGHMGGCIDNYSHFFYWNGPNRHDLWRQGKEVWHDGEFFPDLMVAEASAFIEKHRDQPWFVYWPINTPHYPLQGTDKWRKRYENLDSPRDKYAAFVSTTDEAIGRLLAKIDELKLRDDTIVIFQSDHGHSTEQRTFGGGGNAGPYRGAKFSLFEGGIRVPAMIRWPGKIPAGATRDQLCTACDWLPTIAALCDVPLPKRKIDGKSLVDVIKSADAASPHEVFHWQSGGGRGGPQWAVREGPWKLIGNPRDTSNKAPLGKNDRLFLVNLQEDVSEMKNIAADHPDVVQRLKRLHDSWIKDVGP